MHLFLRNAESWLKYQLFRGLGRFRVISYGSKEIANTGFVRAYFKISDTALNAEYEGMAEGESECISRVRALAEAYERACLEEFQKLNSVTLDRRFPYGLGVGLRSSTAIRRAYGEYWERKRFHADPNTRNWGDHLAETIDTEYGPVFIARVRSEESQVGTGYGLSAREAENSAIRSSLRKVDYPQEHRTFASDFAHPTLQKITISKNPWLECYLVGTILRPPLA